MKQTFKTIYASAVVAAMVLTATPVAAKTKASIKSVSVTNLPAKTLTLKKGKSKTLKFKVTKTGTISTALAYKTSNKKVATVSSKGVVKAKKKGKAKITAYAKKNKNKKVVITVTVGTPVTKVKLNKTKAIVYKGKTYALKATITPKNASNKKVVWTTSNKKIAKVTSKGKVTAVKAGKAKITATAADGSGKKATATITVRNKTSGTTATTTTATAVTSATVQDPRNIAITLNKAQALDKSQITVQSKGSEAANFRYTDQIKSISTADNVNYTIFLKDSIGDNENVRITVTGLANNPTASTVETYYSGLVTSSSSERTISLKQGERTTVYLFSDGSDYSDYYKYEVVSGSLPTGMQRNEKTFGNYEIYGSPTAGSDIAIKRTNPHGDTVTRTFHFKLYSKDAVALSGTNTYNLKKSIDRKNTETTADDTLGNAQVDIDVSSAGGQTYQNEAYVNNATGATITTSQYDDQKNQAGTDAYNAEEDKYMYVGYYSYSSRYALKTALVNEKDPAYVYTAAYTTTNNSTSTVYVKNDATEKTANDKNVTKVTIDGETKYYSNSDVITLSAYNKLKEDYDNTYYRVNATQSVKKTDTIYSSDYYAALEKAEKDAEDAFAAQYTYKDYEDAHYEFVGDAYGLTIKNGNITGSLAGNCTITVKATKKNSAGADVSDTMNINFNVEDSKLVKGYVTDINGKAVVDAYVDFDNRKADSAFGGTSANSNALGQYEAVVENSTYYVTVSKNQSDSFTKDVVINADDANKNLAVDGVAVTLAPSDPNAGVPSELYDDNNYSYSIEAIRSDADNDGYLEHVDEYQVVLNNGETYNLVSGDYSYTVNSVTTDYNASVSNLTVNNTAPSAVLTITKK